MIIALFSCRQSFMTRYYGDRSHILSQKNMLAYSNPLRKYLEQTTKTFQYLFFIFSIFWFAFQHNLIILYLNSSLQKSYYRYILQSKKRSLFAYRYVKLNTTLNTLQSLFTVNVMRNWVVHDWYWNVIKSCAIALRLLKN